MLWACSTSTDDQLTTTGAVALELFNSTSVSTSEFARINALITRASRWAESYIGYPLTAAVYAETVPGFGSRTLRLSRTPIRAIDRIFDSTSTDTANDYTTQIRIEDAEAGLLSMDGGFPWSVGVEQGLATHPLPGQESRPWYVTYEAGYIYDTVLSDAITTSTERTLPDDIEAAVISKCTAYHQGTDGVQSKKVGDLSITYSTYQRQSDAPAENLLAPYRRYA